MSRELNKLKKMIKSLEKNYNMITAVRTRSIFDSEFRDVMEFASQIIDEHENFFSRAISESKDYTFTYEEAGEFIGRLDEFIRLEERIEKEAEKGRLFLGAEDQLKAATNNLEIGFKSKKFGPVFTSLGTSIDLALKDKLELPVSLSIREASVKKMLGIIGGHTVLGKFCNEIYKNVYDVRSKVEHHGFNPTQGQAIESLKLTEDFIRKLKKVSIPENVVKEIHEKM